MTVRLPRPIALLIIFGACSLVGAVTAYAQIPASEFRRILKETAALTADELSALDNAEVVAKSLPTVEKQELSAVGIVRITGVPAISMTTFRESLYPKSGDTVTAAGKFSSPPAISDLQSLELEDDTLEELKKCTVGKCDLNMPAQIIRRFETEIDWNAPDHRAAATRLFREMLLAFAVDYLTSGDDGLGRYDNRRKPVHLRESHRSLLKNALFIDELVPEFAAYLRSFPAKELANVESSLHWSIVDFGLKPSITLSHSTAYTQAGAESQLFLASKQIYASRYLDSSLTLTMLLRVSNGDSIDTYLVLADRSRSDALEGPMGGLARGVVRRESLDRLRDFLEKAQIRILTPVRFGPTPSGEESERGGVDSGIRWSWISFAAILVTSGLVALFFWRRRRDRTARL